MRDTDQDWCAIGETLPYFGVLAHERFKNPSPEDLKDFFATGEVDIAHSLALCRRVFGPFEPKSALDFGCGVGRLLIPLAKLTGNATGIDIADSMLSLARKHAEDAGASVVLAKSMPSNQTFDWVNSQIVLQHIPAARGYPIIRDLWRAVAPNGLLALQITAFRDKSKLGELSRDVSIINYDGERAVNYSEVEDREPKVSMSMYDYELSRVFACMPMKSGSPAYLEKTDHGGFHGFRIYVKRLI